MTPMRPRLRTPTILALAALLTSALGLPTAAAEADFCPSTLVAGARTPARPATSGVMQTVEVDGHPTLAYAEDAAIVPALKVQDVPAFVQGNLVQVVLSLDVVGTSAVDVTWGFSRVAAVDTSEPELLRCAPIAGASGALALQAPSTGTPGHTGALVTYVFDVAELVGGLHLLVTEQGTGVVSWNVAIIPLATVCPTIVDPSCPIN